MNDNREYAPGSCWMGCGTIYKVTTEAAFRSAWPAAALDAGWIPVVTSNRINEPCRGVCRTTRSVLDDCQPWAPKAGQRVRLVGDLHPEKCLTGKVTGAASLLGFWWVKWDDGTSKADHQSKLEPAVFYLPAMSNARARELAGLVPGLIERIEKLEASCSPAYRVPIIAELVAMLEEYRMEYTDSELDSLAACTTGMGEISPRPARREIRRREVVAEAKAAYCFPRNEHSQKGTK